MKIAEIECVTTFNSTGQLEETCRQTLGETSIALTQIGEGLQIVAIWFISAYSLWTGWSQSVNQHQ